MKTLGAMARETAEEQRGRWHESEPPKDGSPLVLCGGVMIKDEYATAKIPFCALAYWDAEMKEWRRWEDGLTVRRTLEDEVIVHFWVPYPQARPGDRPAHEQLRHYHDEED